jgi:hypothetical protein
MDTNPIPLTPLLWLSAEPWNRALPGIKYSLDLGQILPLPHRLHGPLWLWLLHVAITLINRATGEAEAGAMADYFI